MIVAQWVYSVKVLMVVAPSVAFVLVAYVVGVSRLPRATCVFCSRTESSSRVIRSWWGHSWLCAFAFFEGVPVLVRGSLRGKGREQMEQLSWNDTGLSARNCAAQAQ